MFTKLPRMNCTACLLVAAVLAFADRVATGHGGGGGSSMQHRASHGSGNKLIGTSNGGVDLAGQSMEPRHSGQVAATKENFFEVVYLPHEIRVYRYSPSRRSLSVAGIRGEVVLQVNGNPQQYRYPLKAIEGSSLTQDRGYLLAQVDVSRVRDGDMQVTFDLKSIPTLFKERKVRFAQTFALTVPIAVAQLTRDDRPLVDRQRLCPVMDEPLGSHGDPIKLTVNNQFVYVCCEGCIAEVRKNPRYYIRKASWLASQPRQAPTNVQPRRPQVTVNWATRDDVEAVRAQRMCPVMEQPLGEHGTPIKVTLDGQPIFVCCKGCIDRVVENPGPYFDKITSPPQLRRLPAPSPNVVVSYASPSDEGNIRYQENCPVMKQRLGSHRDAIKIVIDGQPIFVCCRGCVGKVEQNPQLYLSKVMRGEQLDSSGDSYRQFQPSRKASVGGTSAGGKSC